MRRKRSADFHRAKTAEEKCWYAAGIPSTGWADYTKEVDYYLIADPGITATQQTTMHQQILTGNLFDDPYLAIVSSQENDETSLRLSFEMVKVALRQGRRVHLTNAAKYHPFYSHQDVDEEDESVQLLYNVHPDSGTERIQLARDWIHNHDDVFRIIATSGDPSDLEKLLKVEAHVLLLVSQRKAKKRIQG